MYASREKMWRLKKKKERRKEKRNRKELALLPGADEMSQKVYRITTDM